YHIEDYKVTFDDCVAASRAATTTTQATAEQCLKEVIEALQHERDMTHRKDEEIRILKSRLEKSNQHLATERETVAKRDDMIKSLTSQHLEKICHSILEYSIQQQTLFQQDKKARDEVCAKLVEEKQRVDDLVTTAQDKMQNSTMREDAECQQLPYDREATEQILEGLVEKQDRIAPVEQHAGRETLNLFFHLYAHVINDL
ncbi:MAG: hypothetical protein Q9192_009065, partial [Flavoplaca navasiana]